MDIGYTSAETPTPPEYVDAFSRAPEVGLIDDRLIGSVRVVASESDLKGCERMKIVDVLEAVGRDGGMRLKTTREGD